MGDSLAHGALICNHDAALGQGETAAANFRRKIQYPNLSVA
jgi:hypothetical protein